MAKRVKKGIRKQFQEAKNVFKRQRIIALTIHNKIIARDVIFVIQSQKQIFGSRELKIHFELDKRELKKLTTEALKTKIAWTYPRGPIFCK